MKNYKVLIATPFLSEKPIRGYESIALAIVEDLFRRNYHIDLLSLDSDNKRRFNFKYFDSFFNKIILIRIEKIQRFINIIGGFFKGESLQVTYFKGKKSDFINTIKTIEATDYDLIISITIRMASYVNSNNPKAFKVIHLIDPHVLNYSRSIVWENFLMRMFYKIDYPRLFKFEMDVLKKFQFRTLISDEDIKEMSLIYGIEFNKLPYGSSIKNNDVDFPSFHERDPNMIVISGNMSYKPNVLAVKSFCSEVFPFLLKFYPYLKLYIIGSNPTKGLLKLRSNNIIITGYVDNIDKYLRKAIVSICPVKHRIGVQTKILEAFSNQLPVIATSNSNSGIKAIDGKEILIADNPEEFLKHYQYLLDKNNWKIISSNCSFLLANNFNLKVNISNSNTSLIGYLN